MQVAKIALVSSLLLCSNIFFSQVSAAVVSRDFSGSGDGLITFDSNNNLEWLDVSLTVGISRNTALNLYKGEGFRLASADEVVSLFLSAGIDSIVDFRGPTAIVGTSTELSNVTSVPGRAGLANLHKLLGWTPTAFHWNPWIHGYLDDEDGDGLSYFARLISPSSRNFNRYGAHVNSNGSSPARGPNRPQQDVGSFLVRTVVPEPATLSILLLGYVTLLPIRKRCPLQ